ncbi:5-bromo-4-chloroindolyl phosphate hydrolysis family protein [Aerococcaceae bacterium INB8]|uniref:5-bromo-4-chloroindolyl phosphate hydrolysis family protein n=1 Tax=Ruoffia halotolerans TaxID=2748684 RepID=A0A839A8U0_9LACT|nr:5-bromo-4-chloroindolyl phosphate hydrolysis family protein [Ruoffia halotolerans]MBA5730123.1 5-bromo-4-chloroindolyl phosphate hydrolysis family protein [Ruoffia halotolerans]
MKRPHTNKSSRKRRNVPMIIVILLFLGILLSGSTYLPYSLIYLTIVIVMTLGSISTLSRLYNHQTNDNPHVLQTIVYLFSLLSLAGAGLNAIFEVDYHMINNIILLFILCLTTLFGFGVMTFIIDKIFVNQPKSFTKNPFYRSKATDKIQHYREAGLSDEEISYFREQLAQAREHIISIEKQMSATAKLRAIDVRHNTIEISKQFFQDIVKEPKRFSEAGDVIYRIFPSLDDLTKKYNEVSKHIAKNKQTYLILEKSAQTIEELAERLTEDYISFHKATYQDLDDEINLANRTLNRQQTNEPSKSVDDILEDWNNMDKDDDIETKE